MSLCYLCLTLLHVGLAALWQAVDTQAVFTIDQVALTLLPGNEVTSGTNVILRCEAKVSHSLPQPLTYSFSFLQDDVVVYTKNISRAVLEKSLSPVRVSNSGRYHCIARIHEKFKKSSNQKLTVTGLQTPMLKVKSDIISEGDEVSATCSALEETGSLIFYFYENNQEIKRVPVSSISATTMLTMQETKETYLHCDYTVVMHPGAGSSNKSNTLKIIVKDLEEITPKIYITPSENVVEGDWVKIQCVVKQPSDVDVFLTKDITVLHKFHTNFTHSFKVNAEDSGNYVCKAEKGNVQKTATSWLSVAELFSKPILRLIPGEVFEGDRFHLNCTSDVKVRRKINKTDIRFILLKENRQLHNYTYIASPGTNGNYSCVAMAKGVNKTSLPLVFKAKVPVSAPVIRTVGNVIVGRPFRVLCKAENGTLPITYTLLKDRSPVANRMVKEAADMAVFDITSISHPLEINRFTCQAYNQDPSFSRTSRISKTSIPLTATVIEPVSTPALMAISLTVTEGSDLYLICKVQQGTPPLTFRWYHDDILIPASSQEVRNLQSAHIVKAIEREQRGRYYCEATNYASEIKKSSSVTITVSLAVWKKALIGVLCILLLVAIIIALTVLLRKKSNPRRKKQANELSVKPRPKSGDPMRMSLTLDIEDNTALNGTPCVMGRNVWSEHVSCSESDHSEEESEMLHPKEVDSNREVPVMQDIETEHNTQSTDVQVSTPGVLEQPEDQAALEYVHLNSEKEPA